MLSATRPIRRLATRRLATLVHDRFALLNTERQFGLDEQRLHQTYKSLMAEAHPDRHGTAEASAQQAIADHASEITDAYAVLKAPHSRATHLLELLGAPLDEDTGGEVLGPGFLMQVMEVREELEEAGSRTEVLRDLLEANQASIAELLEQLIPAFDDAAAADLERARMLTAQLQYLNKIDEEITKRLPFE